MVQADKPITINMPYEAGDPIAEMRLYQDGKLIASRRGTKNRNNDEQLVFKIDRNYDRIIIDF